MNDEVFLDTNVIVYAYDASEPTRQTKAQAILEEALRNEKAHVSAQVLGEFFVVVTKRIHQPMSVAEAQVVIEALAVLPVHEIDAPLVHRAIATHERYRISYWDSLILAAAERARCEKLYSEDLGDGHEYNGVLVVNPFRA